MKMNMSICDQCGAPLPIPANEFPKGCRFCRHRFGDHWEPPQVSVLDPRMSALNAVDTVSKELKHKEVSRSFLSKASLERTVLYYIPILEFGGSHAPGPFDTSIAENTIRTTEQLPFDPVEMRKKGVVFPLRNLRGLLKKIKPRSHGSGGSWGRLVYFPVWEVAYRFRGIVFKSYVSAVDGIPLKLQAFRCHKKKSWMSLFGLLSLAILLGRAINQGGGPLALSAIFILPVSALLLPYFWELFAFREIVEIQGETVSFKEIDYPENSFKESFRRCWDPALGKFFKK